MEGSYSNLNSYMTYLVTNKMKISSFFNKSINFIFFKLTIFFILRPIISWFLFLIIFFSFRYYFMHTVFADDNIKIRKAITASIHNALPQQQPVSANLPDLVIKSTIDVSLAPRPCTTAGVSSIGATFPSQDSLRLKRDIAYSMESALRTHTHIPSMPTPVLPELAQDILFANMQVDFNNYDKLLAACQTKEEVVIMSLNYWKNVIPQEMWATTPDQLSNSNSIINQYLDKTTDTLVMQNQLECFSLLHMRASISTYNAFLLHKLNYEDQPQFAETIFYNALNKMINHNNTSS